MATTKKEDIKEEIIEEKAIEPEKKVKVFIPSSRDEDSDVYVSVNDRTYLVQRDVEVEVPVSVAKVIRQSIKANRAINKARKAHAVK